MLHQVPEQQRPSNSQTIFVLFSISIQKEGKKRHLISAVDEWIWIVTLVSWTKVLHDFVHEVNKFTMDYIFLYKSENSAHNAYLPGIAI